MMKILYFAIILSFVSNLFANQNNAVVATVNGKKILFADLEKTYQQNLLYVSDKPVSRKKVLNDLINRELGIQRARKKKLNEDPIVKYKMEDVMYHAQISKDLEGRLKKIVVTDKDVLSYYKKNPEYRTAHILLRVKAIPDEAQWKQAQSQIFSIHNILIKSPDKFEELANKYSQSTTAPNGGDIGFQPVVKLAPEYFNAIHGKAPGHITSPVRTQFGYHIIKVIAVKEANSINKPVYKKIVYDTKRDKILDDYFKELRANAKVTVNKKFAK